MNSNTTSNNQNKPVSAPFELETKIRLIIQEVLAATIRKLSHFNEKVDKFQDYFITFKERFEIVQTQKDRNNSEMKRNEDQQIKLKNEFQLQNIRYNEEKEREKIHQKELQEHLQDLQKVIKNVQRQNETINSELSKTKSKFLQYSNVITGLKQEVSWKITKYLEETAQNHTQMKLYSENMKNQYFHINLSLEKQKQKYDRILLMNQENDNLRDDLLREIQQLKKQSQYRKDDLKTCHSKIDQVQLSFLSKIKALELKSDAKFAEADKNNAKLVSAFKKIDGFSKIVEEIKQQIEENQRKIIKKIEENGKKMSESINQQILKVNKEALKLEKTIDKKLVSSHEKLQKLQDFFIQKLEFVKMQIQSQMSNKTVKMLEQKSKTEQNMASSTMDEINNRLNKMTLDSKKDISKVQNYVKQSIGEVKKSIEVVKESIEVRLENATFSGGEGGSVSSQRLTSYDKKIQEIHDHIARFNTRIFELEEARNRGINFERQMKKKMGDDFIDLEEKVTAKVQKVMFLVTKIRGDSIIRNEFNDREIKQIKKNINETKEYVETVWKLLPGMGECLYLILSLIYDAEFQHSKIIQDNLPQLAKDVEKFNTTCQGVIYQFKEKKKPGIICYRHNQIKKTDIVKATFCGYIQLWENIYDHQLKTKVHLLPKSFYKKMVEKNLKGGSTKTIPANPNDKSNTEEKGSSGSSQMLEMVNQKSSSQVISNNNENVMNSSFHIRKKKTMSIKEKEDFVMILSQDPNKIIKE